MAIDTELISSEGFNLKIKNYLRDFYVYQFKEKDKDFRVKDKDSRAKKKNDKDGKGRNITAPTFNADVYRLQFALEKAAGVTWNNGDFADLANNRINPVRKNKRVECVTVDSRTIGNNPFFSVYRLCSESTSIQGTHFSLIYTVLLYFNLGGAVKRTDFAEIDENQLESLFLHLKRDALYEEAEKRHHKEKAWSKLSEKDREFFASKAIDRFSKNYTEYEEIHKHMLMNNERIVYSDGKFEVKSNGLAPVEKNTLYEALSLYGIGIDIKQFTNKMDEFARLGIIKKEKCGRKIYYGPNDILLSDIIGGDDDLATRFSEFVAFFAQTGTLGEIGSYIQNRMPRCNGDYLRFKHNYIKRALNDYNNIDLLFAIKNNLFAVIDYCNAAQDDMMHQTILCYPMEIRESVTDGRQYLIYYHPVFRSVSAARIEFIDSIKLGKLPKKEYFEEDIDRAKYLINHTWGTAFDDFREGNVKSPAKLNKVRVVVRFAGDENFIKARLEKEIRNCGSLNEFDSEEYGHCIEVNAQVINPWEMLPWLRSYITRVVSVEFNGEEFSGFINDVIGTYESYLAPGFTDNTNISSRIGKSLLHDKVPVDFDETDNMHSLLFNEFFGGSFEGLGSILSSVISKEELSKAEIKELESDYSKNFSDVIQINKRKTQANGFIRAFVAHREDKIQPVFTLSGSGSDFRMADLIPLTSLEIQWLINMLGHPLAKCFFSPPEIKQISEKLEIAEQFDVNSVVLYDQHIGVEKFYDNPDFGTSIREIMQAIRKNQTVKIKYKSQYDKISYDLCAPVYLEYSKRDNRIRLRAVGQSKKARTYNLERIIDASVYDRTYDRKAAEKIIAKHVSDNECELTVDFNETKNVPDRILTEFSCFKKKCVKWGDKRYRMTLYYDREDEREILIRLLGYGLQIKVFDDTGNVRHQLIERLEHQLELSKCMDKVFADTPHDKNGKSEKNTGDYSKS